jgi:hypothetical protein
MTNNKAKTYSQITVIWLALLCVAFLLPIGRDWQTWNVLSVEQIQQPYSMPDFTGMPFAFFALPHSLLSIDIGNAVNLSLNIMVMFAVAYRYAGKQWHIALAIAMTTPMFINLIMSNNIDWIPLAAFLVHDNLAYPLLAMKPQMLGASAIIRFKRNPQLTRLLPLFALLIVSVLIWGAWWGYLGNGLTMLPWNFAPFPYFIPLGIYLLVVAWQKDDEIIGACATPFLVPYFAPYSLAGLHVLLAARHRKAAMWLWCFSWWFLIIASRRLG